MQPQITRNAQNVIYFYDLPKNDYTSVKLTTEIKKVSGVDVQQVPQVRRDLAKPFYTAILKFDNQEQFERVKNDFRYFSFEGKPCRALPYFQDLLGTNVAKLQENNTFVRKIPKDKTPKELEEFFSKYGGIISCKISLDENHKSRGYGFVCFQEPENAAKALGDRHEKEEFIGVKYNPKGKQEMRKVFNNIFVKNLPNDVTDDEMRALFAPYGNITSLYKGTSEKEGKHFYFICFGSTNKNDIEYGPRAAAEAVSKLHDQEYKGQKLYVVPAQKKEERKKVIEHESLKYKTSKKRCNLYVKGFDAKETEESLKQLFQSFGEIESIRVFEASDGKSPYAFVCYKTPDTAQLVKNTQNLTLNGRTLYVNHYEIKQYRDIKNEDARDKQDFARHQQEQNGGFQNQNFDQLTQIIKTLMMSMKPPGMYPNGGQRSHSQNQYQNNYQQNQQSQGYPNRSHSQNPYPNQGQRGGHFQGQGYNNRSQNMQMQVQNPVHRPQPISMPLPTPTSMPLPGPPIGTPMGFPTQPVNQVAPSQHPLAPSFYSVTVPIVGAVNEMNPNYKQTVGSAIFEFVSKLVGPHAPKVTGMLIDLPVVEIQKYMLNFDLFFQRIQQATALLESQQAAQQH